MLKTAFPKAELVEFNEIIKDTDLNKYDLLWWHYDKNTELPQIAKTDNVKQAIASFLKQGKRSFTHSSFSTVHMQSWH